MARKLRQVLIIDDDMTTNYLNQRLLSELEFADTIKVVHNGKAGLEYILEHCFGDNAAACPELVILDHYMPVMDGMEMMETLHKMGKLDKLRSVFILLAIHTDTKDLKKFQTLGVQEFTTKPLSKAKLKAAYNKYWADNTVRDHTPE